jgi:ribosomal protein S18 acetylase RimI-like enzyme
MKSQELTYHIRRVKFTDLITVAQVHSVSYLRQKNSIEWMKCNYNAFPRIKIFVAEVEGEVVGYIQWIEKSGFRKEVILELEQIAVLPKMRNQGIATSLIRSSLLFIAEELSVRDAKIKHILVTTRSDNEAQKLYRNTLNAVVETTIPDLYSSDEVLMIARNFSLM